MLALALALALAEGSEREDSEPATASSYGGGAAVGIASGGWPSNVGGAGNDAMAEAAAERKGGGERTPSSAA